MIMNQASCDIRTVMSRRVHTSIEHALASRAGARTYTYVRACRQTYAREVVATSTTILIGAHEFECITKVSIGSHRARRLSYQWHYAGGSNENRVSTGMLESPASALWPFLLLFP